MFCEMHTVGGGDFPETGGLFSESIAGWKEFAYQIRYPKSFQTHFQKCVFAHCAQREDIFEKTFYILFCVGAYAVLRIQTTPIEQMPRNR